MNYPSINNTLKMEAECSEEPSVVDYMAIHVRKTITFTVTAKRTPGLTRLQKFRINFRFLALDSISELLHGDPRACYLIPISLEPRANA
jgi:hypothetical protein